MAVSYVGIKNHPTPEDLQMCNYCMRRDVQGKYRERERAFMYLVVLQAGFSCTCTLYGFYRLGFHATARSMASAYCQILYIYIYNLFYHIYLCYLYIYIYIHVISISIYNSCYFIYICYTYFTSIKIICK